MYGWIADIGNTFNDTWDNVAAIAGLDTSATLAAKSNKELATLANKNKELELQQTEMLLAAEKERANREATEKSAYIIPELGIDKRYLIYGGAGFGAILLIVLLVVALK